VKELAEINAKGTPPGIVLLNAESMEEWRFLISVLGDETIYKVRPGIRPLPRNAPRLYAELLGRNVRAEDEVWESVSHRMPRGEISFARRSSKPLDVFRGYS
jgi:hypothetical protein